MAKSKSKNGKGNTNGAVPKITGQGDYRTTIADIKQRLDRVLRLAPKGSFGRAGTAAGMAFGGPVGAAVGGALGRGVSAITGYGDYEVKQNSLSTMSTSMDTVPQFVRNDHAVRVIHREYVRDLQVPTIPSEFVNNTFVINPSNSQLFPWLSSLSKQYQQYNIRGMIVEFKSMSSDYAASGPLGTVAIATNYNVSDLPFASKIALENSEFAVSCKPSMSLMHAIECDPEFSGRKYYYVRDAATEGSGTSDPRLYDMGLLQIATNGLPGEAGTTLGEIWVSYDIEFTKPILPSSFESGRRPIIGGEGGGDGGVDGVTTVDGTVVTSQLDGSSSFAGGSYRRIRYTQQQGALTPSYQGSTQTPFGHLEPDLTSYPITTTLDTGLDGTVCTLGSSGMLNISRDGLYTVTYTTYCHLSSGKTIFSDPATDVVPHNFVLTGSATVAEIMAVGVCRHNNTSATGTKPMMTYTLMFTVSGCGPSGSSGNSARLDPPEVQIWDLELADAGVSTCDVTWAQYQTAQVVDE